MDVRWSPKKIFRGKDRERIFSMERQPGPATTCFRSMNPFGRICIVVLFILVIMITMTQADKPKYCRRKRYTAEVRLPGTDNPNCRKNITLTYCGGVCESQSVPSMVYTSSGLGVYWQNNCRCCSPSKFIRKTISFPLCQGVTTILEIRRCACGHC